MYDFPLSNCQHLHFEENLPKITLKWSKNIFPNEKKPINQSGHSIVIYDNTIYSFGGYSKGEALNNVIRINLFTYEWEKVETNGDHFAPRTSHSVVLDEMKGYAYVLFGSGSVFGSTNLDDVMQYDLLYNRWTSLHFNGIHPRGRYGQAAVLYNSKIYVFAGTFGILFSDELFCYDLETMKCTLLHPSGNRTPSPRYKHSACLVDNQMYIFGGGGPTNHGMDELFCLNLDTLVWKQITLFSSKNGISIEGRFAHSMIYDNINYRLIIYGGTNKHEIFNNLYEISLEDFEIHQIEYERENSPATRYFHGCCFNPKNCNLYIFGGKGSINQDIRYNDFYSIPIAHPSDQTSISEDFLDFYKRNDLTDFQFNSIDGDTFNVHTPIIMARCPVLCDSISSLRFNTDKENENIDMNDEYISQKENIIKNNNNNDIRLWQDFNPHIRHSGLDYIDKTIFIPFNGEIFNGFLEYLYSDKLIQEPNQSVTYFLNLIACAENYGMFRLRNLCLQRIRNMMNPYNALLCLCDPIISLMKPFRRYLIRFLENFEIFPFSKNGYIPIPPPANSHHSSNLQSITKNNYEDCFSSNNSQLKTKRFSFSNNHIGKNRNYISSSLTESCVIDDISRSSSISSQYLSPFSVFEKNIEQHAHLIYPYSNFQNHSSPSSFSFSPSLSSLSSSTFSSTPINSKSHNEPLYWNLIHLEDDIEEINLAQNEKDSFQGAIVIYPSTLGKDLLNLRTHLQSICPCDFVFRFEDINKTVIHSEWVHLCILAARSGFFGCYSFCKGMIEAHKRECIFPYNQHQLSPSSFNFLINYLHGGEIFFQIVKELLSNKATLNSQSINHLSPPDSFLMTVTTTMTLSDPQNALLQSFHHQTDYTTFINNTLFVTMNEENNLYTTSQSQIEKLIITWCHELLSIDMCNYFCLTNHHLAYFILSIIHKCYRNKKRKFPWICF